MLEGLTDDPMLLVIVGVIVLAAVGSRVWRWRRESSMDDHAEERGWRSVEGADGFAHRVVERFPELRDEAERDARASRGRRGRGPGRGPGTTVSVGPRGPTRSEVDARNVHVLPADGGGGIAVGDVTAAGRTGRLSQGRANRHRGAAVARLSTELPDLKLLARDWIDRDTRGDLPEPVTRRFNDVPLDDAARARYLDSRALTAIADAEVELDGVAVEGDTAVFLSRQRLTPERAVALAGVATDFLDAVAGSDDGSRDQVVGLREPLDTARP